MSFPNFVLLVLCLTVFVQALFGYYGGRKIRKRIAQGKKIKGGTFAFVTFFFGYFGMLSFSQHWTLILLVPIAAFVGWYVGLELGRKPIQWGNVSPQSIPPPLVGEQAAGD